MDQRERLNDQQEMLRAAMFGHQAEVWTALPGIVESVNPNGTLNAQPAIQGRVRLSKRAPTGEDYQWIDLPLLLDCPVIWMGGGNFVETFPIAKGDEVLIVFAARCIDMWWQQGGVQKQGSLRMHDLSDGFAVCGPRSQPRKLTDVSTTTMQLRSLDGTQYIELAPAGVVNIVAPGGVNITGAVTVTGEVTANGVALSHHHHSDPQGGTTGYPVP